MKFKNKIFLLGIFIAFVCICGAYSIYDHGNNDSMPVISNETDSYGCCSIVLQLDGNNTLMSHRRDSNVTADVFIEKVDWHGFPAIKQYKNENGYFNHVIVTNKGWVIGFGGIDDGIDNEVTENITATMINDDYNISEFTLKKIQDMYKDYGRGHVVIKAPNGNYGFVTPEKLKTGTLQPGQYISIPNDYFLSRSGNISLDEPDKIQNMAELSQSDLYGLDRREIIIYDFKVGENENTTDIYVSNEDGSYLGIDYSGCIDNVFFNGSETQAKDIPIAPDYKKIGSVSFDEVNTIHDNTVFLLFTVGFVVFVGILFFVVLRFVRFIKFHIRR